MAGRSVKITRHHKLERRERKSEIHRERSRNRDRENSGEGERSKERERESDERETASFAGGLARKNSVRKRGASGEGDEREKVKGS